MKNLFYLFSALLVFACSSDDSSDESNNSNQTFLERYTGIVWESTENNGNKTSFDLNGFIQKHDECVVYTWGVENPDTGVTWNLLENNYDSAMFNLEEDGIIDFTSTITVSDDENTLTEYISDDEICTVVRTNLADPCE